MFCSCMNQPYKLFCYLTPRTYKMWFKHAYQRIRRGWSDQDVWNLDVHLASVISTSCAELKRVDFASPPELSSYEWDSTLDSIITGFGVYAKKGSMYELSPEEFAQYELAKTNFKDWHESLWW